MRLHPEAKVLLSVRNPERWYESTRSTIYPLTLLLDSSRTVRLIFGLATLLACGVIWDGTFDGRFEDEAYAIEVFEQHNREVKRRVPPERLLVYEIKEGWGPLCEFLGVPEPEEPFPRLHDAAQMQRAMKAVRMLDAALPFMLLLAIGVSFVLLMRRRARARTA